MKKHVSLLSALFSLLVLTAGAQAQDTPALPNIAPREFEIRGELVIQFPSLERQPLTGFNPPPRVYELPSDRRPFIGSYRLDAASLPPSPLRPPEPPPAALTIGGDPNQNRLESGLGSLLTREVRLDLYRASRQGFFYTRIAYDGSDGHTATPDRTAPYESAGGVIGWEATTRAFNAGIEAAGAFEAYRLYGTEPAPTSAVDTNPWRNGTSGSFSGWIRSGTQLPFGYEVDLDYTATQFATFAFDGETAPAFRRSDKRLTARTRLTAPLGDARLDLSGTFYTGVQDDGAFLGNDDLSYDAGGVVRFVMPNALDLALGARVIGFATSPVNDDRWASYVAPDVRIGLQFSNTLRLYARNIPFARAAGLADLFEENPFLLDEPLLQPELALLNPEAGFTLNLDPVRLEGHAGFTDYRNYRFFEHDAPPEYDTGFFRASYEPAQIFEAGASLTLLLTRTLHATARTTFREGQLTRNDEEIPYLAPFDASLALGVLFDRNKGLVQMEATAEGSRPVDRLASETLDPYARLDLHTSYEVTRRLALYVRLRNLLNSSYQRWAGYEAAPLVALGGLRVQW